MKGASTAATGSGRTGVDARTGAGARTGATTGAAVSGAAVTGAAVTGAAVTGAAVSDATGAVAAAARGFLPAFPLRAPRDSVAVAASAGIGAPLSRAVGAASRPT